MWDMMDDYYIHVNNLAENQVSAAAVTKQKHLSLFCY